MMTSETELRGRRLLSRVLPHEWAFGLFLAVMGLRLSVHDGDAAVWSLFFLGAIGGAWGLIWWGNLNPTPLRWRIRLLYYPAIMGLTFLALGICLPLLQVRGADALLLKWENSVFGVTPSVIWQLYARPWLTDLMMAAYLSFFYYLIFGPAYYCIRQLPVFRKCFVGLFVLYALAFTGYMLFPAGGPFRYIHFTTPLHGPLIYDWTVAGVNGGSNAVDVFPSVHVAASMYLLLFDWHHRRGHFWLMLFPCVLLWIATMYLRYHYALDIVAGVAVGLAGWTAAAAYERSGVATVVDMQEQLAVAGTEEAIAPETPEPEIVSSSGQFLD